tara:strand:- start:542 stop:6220 length:5679 start_codon:yes stop_codon:yes gene_type:complete
MSGDEGNDKKGPAIELAKRGRTTSKRIMAMAISNFLKAIDKGKPNSSINNLFLKIEKKWEDVQETHAEYLAALLSDDEGDPPANEAEWISTCFEKYNEAEEAKARFDANNQPVSKNETGTHQASESDKERASELKATLSKPANTSNQLPNIKKLKRAVKFERSTLVSCAQNLEAIAKDEDTSIDTIKEAQIELKSWQDQYMKSQKDLILITSDDEELEEEMKLSQQLQRLCIQANVEAGKIISKREKKSHNQSTEKKSSGLELKLERMKLPSFSGDVREFPRFKQEFGKFVKPLLKEEDEAIYILKKCLANEALDQVKNVDSSLDEMWKRLEEKFGRTSTIVRHILVDIKSISTVAEGENAKFVKLVNTVESCYRDLERIGMESEMKNSTVVASIEDKLPPTIRSMWSLEVCEDTLRCKDMLKDDEHNHFSNDRNQFPELLNFLLKHRRAIEYGTQDLKRKQSRQVEFSVSHVQDAKPPVEESATQNRKSCWYHHTNKHDITECSMYKSSSVKERWNMIMDYRVCWCCLRPGHRQDKCYSAKPCGTNECKANHHVTLHREDTRQTKDDTKLPEDYPVGHTSNTDGSFQVCLLQLMKINAGFKGDKHINGFFDGGSKVTLITFKKARELGLEGTKIKINIIKVGGTRETIDSQRYKLPLMDSGGNIHYFYAYGITQISAKIEHNEMSKVAEMLEVDEERIRRPVGEIELLVGLEYAAFHPERVKVCGHLLLMKNIFGECISGAHPILQEKTHILIQDVQVAHANVRLAEFFEAEGLGVSCVPKCGNCSCGKCPIGGKQYTLEQERELAMIDRGLHLSDTVWTSTYPWKKEPHLLPNNYGAALSMLKSTERRLSKNEANSIQYCEQIEDMVQRGAARKLTDKEIRDYTGPVYYISHHEILKPDSKSTPCRIVFNSSAKYMSHTLNDYWAKGPDLVNNLLGILLRFREERVAIAGDISKMYHTVKISELDQHTHRFLWRSMQTDAKPSIYVVSAVSFGDKPAGAIASLALRKTAEMYAEISPSAAKTITENSYVDDIVDSFCDESTATEVIQKSNEILAKGGFRIKEWTVSSYPDHESVMKLGQDSKETQSRVLGVGWNPSKDDLQFETKINFSAKRRNIHVGSNITKDEIEKEVPAKLTRRMILSQVNGIFDPLGLLSPFVVKAKIMLRKLTTEENAGWDDPITEQQRSNWCNFFQEMFDCESIEFNRSTKPENAIGLPVLVIFSDASKEAFGACAYVRWETSNGDFKASLLFAKSKLAPMKAITIPRLELNAALLAARMKAFVIQHVSHKFTKVYCITDSEIVRAMIQKESYGFNTFVAVRIGEIQEVTDQSSWFWIEGVSNIADIITRGCQPSDMNSESIWQRGPRFLEEPEASWPIKQSYSGNQLPDQIVMAMPVVEISPALSSVIDVNRFSSFDKLIRVTARIIAATKYEKGKPSLKRIASNPTRQLMEEAEKRWLIEEQQSLSEQIKQPAMERLGVKQIDGITVVGARIEDWQHHSYNKQNPPVLSAKSQFAQLYAHKVHDQCHLGVSAVVAKIRSKYWIVGLRNLVRSIRHRCVKCRKLDKRIEQQTMGMIPEERLAPMPAWTYVSLDLFGPFQIRGETNRRSRSKGYGIIVNCLLSRAVHVDIVTDYGTDTFLMALRRFMSLRGKPAKIWSDRGSQLVKANKEMMEVVSGYDTKMIDEFTSQHLIEWQFTPPDGPWQNGCAEALIKSVKKAIKISVGEQILTLSEMQTVMYESANLVNERPIGRHPNSTEDGVYLSPNDLLLGRSSTAVPSGQFDGSLSTQVRYRFVQGVITAFWKKWTRDFFPSLVVRQKWHTAKRNVSKGDIVLIQDANSVRGRWKMGRVSKAEPSLRDGFVRSVEVQYKNPGHNVFTTITRPVQRLIVIVPVEE